MAREGQDGVEAASETPDVQSRRIFLPAHVGQTEPDALTLFSEESLTLFGRCLAFEMRREDLTQLRVELLGDPSKWASILNLAELFNLLPALAARLEARGLLIPTPRPHRGDGVHPVDVLRAEAANIATLRSGAKAQLIDVLHAYNSVGIEPLLLKGARSLWSGEPSWRYLCDLDLLVHSEDLERAQAALREQGYEYADTSFRLHSWSHHAPPLARADLPVMVENHGRASNRYAERLLPTAELWRDSIAIEIEGGRCRVLPRALHLLHGLLHYHVAHRGDRAGIVHIRGLYEFAWEFDRLDADGLATLRRRTQKNPRLSAPLDFWIAAANELFALPVREPFRLYADAMERWRKTKGAFSSRNSYKTIRHFGDEIRMACHPDRLAAAGWQHSGLLRLFAGAHVVGSLIRPKLPRPLP